MTRVLVIGNQGQVGWELERCLSGVTEVVGLNRSQLDLCDLDAMSQAMHRLAPTVVINCAAYNAVDGAETEKEIAHRINVDAVRALGEAASRIGAGVIHFSTDYVFPGTGARPYREDDPTGPLSFYGATKLAGEQALMASGCVYWIFRTSWIYSARRSNFIKAVLAKAKTQQTVPIVNDQYGSPTWARTLAQAVATLLTPQQGKSEQLRDFMRGTQGLYHLTAAGATTRFEFARFMFECLKSGVPQAKLLPVATAEQPTVALRPRQAILDNDRFARVFGFRCLDWRVGARLCAAELEEATLAQA
jgi:dTDP-4-dehydrorhamnose reductase